MGYLIGSEADHLTLPSNSEFWVKMKRKATYGDSLAAQSAMLQLGQGQAGLNGQVVTEMEAGAYMRTLVARMLVEWNLTDNADQLLPISEQTVELLDPQDGDFLALEAQKRLGRRGEKEQIPFGKRFGQDLTDTA